MVRSAAAIFSAYVEENMCLRVVSYVKNIAKISRHFTQVIEDTVRNRPKETNNYCTVCD